MGARKWRIPSKVGLPSSRLVFGVFVQCSPFFLPVFAFASKNQQKQQNRQNQQKQKQKANKKLGLAKAKAKMCAKMVFVFCKLFHCKKRMNFLTATDF